MNRSPGWLALLPFALLAVACSDEPPEAVEPGSKSDAIVGGVTDSGTGSFPSVVMLMLPGGSACTATLLAPKLVLTARHCVSNNITEGIGCDVYGNSSNGDHVGTDHAASGIKVFTGVTPSPWGTPVAVGTQIFHPAGKNLCNNDIALVVLSAPITSVAPQKIRLDYGPQIGELTTAVGYGITSDGNWNSGTRRRRGSVPVVSTGQDWNEITGAGELAAGQSICSGDSGGPLISAGGGVIGVSSRVYNCNDPTYHPKFTRVDYHKALILQAFAAAGASPNLEGGSGGEPVKKQTGEGPCSTGAECAGLLCQTAGSYCTSLCGNGSCPTGMLCTDSSIVIGGQPIKEKICTPISSANACEQCRNSNCLNVVSSCLNNAGCTALLACVDACTTPSCNQACIAANPAGADDYDLLRYCSCEGGCATQCAHMCTPTGTGGGGGSTSIGGAGGAGAIGGSVASGGAAATGGMAGAAAAPNQTTGSRRSGGCSVGGDSSSSPLWLFAALLVLARRRRS